MKFLTTKDAADYLQVHEETIRRWVREGILVAYKTGGILRFQREDLDQMLTTSVPKNALTKKERWILSNQYRILEALYPQEAKHLKEHREALEAGYELHYSSASKHIYEEEETLSRDQCKEVIDILDMYWALNKSNNLLENKNTIDSHNLVFPGFDGNCSLEGRYMAYAQFYCDTGGGRFEELKTGRGFNSHRIMLPVYRRMLPVWKSSKNKYAMTQEEMAKVIEAKTHPEFRDN